MVVCDFVQVHEHCVFYAHTIIHTDVQTHPHSLQVMFFVISITFLVLYMLTQVSGVQSMEGSSFV